MIVVAAVLALQLTGDDGGGDGQLTTAPADLTLEELQPALLTAEDVGPDFTESFDSDQSDFSEDAFQTSDECREALARFDALGGEGSGLEVEFERASDQATISHGLDLVQEDTPSMDEIRDTYGACGTLPFDDGEVQGEIRIRTESVVGFGEDALAVVMEVDASSAFIEVSYEVYGIAWARGGVLSGVSGTGGLDEATYETFPVDRDQIVELARLADQRLQDVLAA